MTKERLAKLAEIKESITALICDIEEVMNEEETEFENLPQPIQETLRGQQKQEFISMLGDIYDNLEYMPSQIESMITL